MNWLKALGIGSPAAQMPDNWTRFHYGFFLSAVTFGKHPTSIGRGDGMVYCGADLRLSIKRHSHIRLSDAEFAAALRLLG